MEHMTPNCLSIDYESSAPSKMQYISFLVLVYRFFVEILYRKIARQHVLENADSGGGSDHMQSASMQRVPDIDRIIDV